MYNFNDLKNKQLENLTIDLTDKSLTLANKILIDSGDVYPFFSKIISYLGYFFCHFNILFILSFLCIISNCFKVINLL